MSGAAFGREGVGRGRRYMPRAVKPFLYAGGLFAAVAGFAVYNRPPPPRQMPAPQAKGWDAGKALHMTHAAPKPEPKPETKPDAPAPPTLPEPPSDEPAPAFLPVLTYTAPAALHARHREMRDPGRAAPVAPGEGAEENEGRGGAGGGTEVSARMQATRLDAIRPGPARGNDSFTLGADTTFDCLTTEPLDSRMVGPITCTAQSDVWNITGDNILIRKFSDVHGMMDKGLAPGERRVWVNWLYARWPKPYRVKLPLSAVGADPMGQNGVPGDYERNLLERFENTLAASVLDFAIGAGSGAAQAALGGTGAGNFFNFAPLGRGASGLANMAFERDRNIPSSIVRGPATIIKVKVMQDIDYSRILQNVVIR